MVSSLIHYCIGAGFLQFDVSQFKTSVLIDDREKLRQDWEAAGGIFIWHTSTQSTLEQLRKKGILKDYQGVQKQAEAEGSVSSSAPEKKLSKM